MSLQDWVDVAQIMTGGASLAVIVIIWLTLRQAGLLRRTLQYQASTNLFEEVRAASYREDIKTLANKFCQHGKFILNADDWQDDHDRLRRLIGKYTKLGWLVWFGLCEKEAVLSLQRDVCIRLWIMTKEYIESERKNRAVPYWQWHFQYLAALSLRSFLAMDAGSTSSRLPRSCQIRIYDSDNNISKDYGSGDLRDYLQQCERDLKNFGVPASRLRG